MLWKSVTGCYLRSVLEGVLFLGAGGLLCAGCCLSVSIPEQIMIILMHILWSISAFYAGKRAGLRQRKHGLGTGLICSVLLCMLLSIGCLLMQEILSARLLIRCFCILLSGMAGGVVGVNTRLRKPPYF